MHIDINYIYGLGHWIFPTPGGTGFKTSLFDENGYPVITLPNDFCSGDLKSSMENFKKDKKYEHYLCPAVKLWHKTNWIVTMPFDIEFQWNKQNKKIDINPNYTSKSLEKLFFDLKTSRFHQENIVEVQMAFFYLFWVKQKNTIILNLNHHPNLAENNIELIPAKVPISDWIRPIHFSFKIIDPDKKIFIKKDTPLFYIDFSCKEDWNAKFNLIKHEKVDEKIRREMHQNMLVSVYSKNSSWELIKQRLFNKKKSCPFLYNI